MNKDTNIQNITNQQLKEKRNDDRINKLLEQLEMKNKLIDDLREELRNMEKAHND